MFNDYNPVTDPAILISMTRLGTMLTYLPRNLELIEPSTNHYPTHGIDHITLSRQANAKLIAKGINTLLVKDCKKEYQDH